MEKLSRRSLLVGAGAGLTAINLGVRRTKAQTSKTLRLSITQSATTADYPAFEQFAQFVANETQGEVTIEIFPSSQLGTEREATEQVKFGAIDMTTGGGDIQGFVPQVGLSILISHRGLLRVDLGHRLQLGRAKDCPTRARRDSNH